jgi:hypothetical protein
LVKLFDENKTKRVEYVNTYPNYPIYRDNFPKDPLSKPYITYCKDDDSIGRPKEFNI